MVGPNEIKTARRIMRTAFEEDPEFRNTYIANIAMLLHDRHGIIDFVARNSAADEILTLIFQAEPG